MGKFLSNLDFKMMVFFFKIRDFFKDPMEKIDKTDVKRGDHVLDYGCGSGSYSVPIAKLVRPSGKVYAADMHPLSSVKVNERAEKHDLGNLKTIKTDCKTELNDKSIDIILLIDVLHGLTNYEENLEEFHRVLKNSGVLWVDDHHYEGKQIKQKVTSTKLFEFVKKVDSLHKFKKSNKNI